MPTDRTGYWLFMVLAFAGFLLARRVVPRRPTTIKPLEQLALGLSAFVGGTLLAKAPFVWEGGDFWNLTVWAADGKTLTTGLVGAYLAVELMKLVLGIREKTGDALAIPLAVALTIGRWGCFVNGCCAGQATGLGWGVNFGDGVPRHPTQIYESLFHFSWVFILLVMARREWLRYQRLKIYLLAYCVFRFSVEFIRIEPLWWGSLTYYQVVVTGFAGFLGVQWLVDARRVRRDYSSTANPPMKLVSR